MASKGYTVKDLVFYAGLMGGAAVTFNLMRPLGYHPFIVAIGSFGVGTILGGAALKLYENMSSTDDKKPDSYSEDDDGPTF